MILHVQQSVKNNLSAYHFIFLVAIITKVYCHIADEIVFLAFVLLVAYSTHMNVCRYIALISREVGCVY